MSGAYYNEIDPYAAQWLRNLISAGHIAPGEVDERSIEDVRPDDLRGFTQCHFFSGIGVWSLALRRAGVADGTRVWTGSCPCQPFSAAGKGHGFADERHLWPAWLHLISQCEPAVVLGEQVASKAVDAWIDLVQTDLEALDYAVGAFPFPSASVGAPHIRDRTYWVADAVRAGRTQGWPGAGDRQATAPGSLGLMGDTAGGRRRQGGLHDTGHRATHCTQANDQPGHASASGRLADADADEQQRHGGGDIGPGGWPQPADVGDARGMADADGRGHIEARRDSGMPVVHGEAIGLPVGDFDTRVPGPTNGYWRDADWIGCRDHRWRPVEPGTFPLAHGGTARVGRLRAYGNAINAEQARIFIEAAGLA